MRPDLRLRSFQSRSERLERLQNRRRNPGLCAGCNADVEEVLELYQARPERFGHKVLCRTCQTQAAWDNRLTRWMFPCGPVPILPLFRRAHGTLEDAAQGWRTGAKRSWLLREGFTDTSPVISQAYTNDITTVN
jgi:hypothetical protein